jgi:hypothetical protein
MDQNPVSLSRANAREKVWLAAVVLYSAVCAVAFYFLSRGPFGLPLNDFAGVAWLAARLQWSRLSTFADLNYPWGYPALLHALSPLFGSTIRAARLVQAASAGAALILLYLLCRRFSRSPRGKPWASFVATAALSISVPFLLVAVSPLADMSAIALVLGGFLLVDSGAGRSSPRVFAGGLLVGAAYLLRYHALLIAALTGLSVLVFTRGGLQTRLRSAAAFALGFCSLAWTVWGINKANFGSAFKTLNQQAIYHYVFQDFRLFNPDYYKTPDVSLFGLLRENPVGFFKTSTHTFSVLVSEPAMIWALALAALALLVPTAPEAERRPFRFGPALVMVALGYSSVVSLTRFTERGYLLVLMLAGILIACGLSALGAQTAASAGRRRLLYLWVPAAVLCYFLVTARGWNNAITEHAAKTRETTEVLDALRRLPGYAPRSVLTYDYEVLPMDDSSGGLFHWFSGWLNYNPRYAKEYPLPPLSDFDKIIAFIREHRIRYIVIRKDLMSPDERPLPEAAKKLVSMFTCVRETPIHCILDVPPETAP